MIMKSVFSLIAFIAQILIAITPMWIVLTYLLAKYYPEEFRKLLKIEVNDYEQRI